MTLRALLALCLIAAIAPISRAAPPLAAADVFELQWAADPQISPDGRQVAYVRQRGDMMKDAYTGDLWLVGADGRDHRPIVPRAASPRWSPDGTRLLYVAAGDNGTQLFVRWLDTGAAPRVVSGRPHDRVRPALGRGGTAPREAPGET